ncbi:signal transduction histidine kinase [Herbaspirillum sp. CF444]|uniref:ATP-binding protein n=1 Tax=Herbaspirillum sp. CF444 TaxID=1144319 RepID=UPI00027257CF|nr:transporter substrate-binding domain-containing protein [Herbaspirillum sp. CF444]EJL88095.1 signal transduction histidine kinase [Herbaspirillum sp. CF444]
MRRFSRSFSSIVLFGLLIPLGAYAIELSTAEKTWLKEHPVVRIAIDPHWKPVEFSDKGIPKGLSVAYLKEIEKETGLKFQLVETSQWRDSLGLVYRGEAELLPATSPDVHEPEGANGQLIYSRPYYVGSTTIISRANVTNIFDSSAFNGMTVAVAGGGMFESWIRRAQPKAALLTFENIDDVLDAVVSGKAQVAIGPELILHTLLRQRYPDQLHIAGSIPSLPIMLRMAARADSPLLISIINKVLVGLPSEKTDLIYQEWIETADYGQPSWKAIIHYYGKETALGALTIVFLLVNIYYMRRAKKIAEDNERQKGMFLAVMSHEIRTPIHAVLASIDLLQNTTLDAHQNKLLHTAISNAETLSNLVNDVLDYSKLEAGAINLEYIPTDIEKVIEEALACIDVCVREKNVKLHVSFAEKFPPLRLDPTRMRQILTNILSNAAKFTNAGSISVFARLEKYGENLAPLLMIEVTDTGIGIPAAAQPFLFAPFKQATSSITREFGGSGLGLAICAELIKEMKGRISITSAPRSGTIVKIIVPTEICTFKATPDSIQSNSPCPSSSRQDKILVIDDVNVNRELISEQLLLLGYSCATAADGATGIKQYSAERFSAILLDCHLPIMSGYDVAIKIREIEEREGFPYIPIIAISAESGDAHTQKCFSSGIDGVLSKPIRLERLRETLALWLRQPDAVTSNSGDVRLSTLTPANSLKEDYALLEKAVVECDVLASRHYSHRIKGVALMLDQTEIIDAIRIFEDTIPRTPFSTNFSSVALSAVERSIKSYILMTEDFYGAGEAH